MFYYQNIISFGVSNFPETRTAAKIYLFSLVLYYFFLIIYFSVLLTKSEVFFRYLYYLFYEHFVKYINTFIPVQYGGRVWRVAPASISCISGVYCLPDACTVGADADFRSSSPRSCSLSTEYFPLTLKIDKRASLYYRFLSHLIKLIMN